jgi:hypothetical protein
VEILTAAEGRLSRLTGLLVMLDAPTAGSGAAGDRR